jgi:glutaconyl-CoA decarboxylase
MGFVDEIAPLPGLRAYVRAFAGAVYQNPKSICPFHQMLLPRTLRDFETFVKV